MKYNQLFEVIIVGGSYAGLSAALSLGRSLRKTLIIDSAKPCNRNTPHSHNFLTHDGETPGSITATAKDQLKLYENIHFENAVVTNITKRDQTFSVKTSNKTKYNTGKLIFATGVKDEMLPIPGFTESWGKSIIHCPYCHGYEFRAKKTGILANGEAAFHYSKLISNLTGELVVLTNGEEPNFNKKELETLSRKNIPVIQKKIENINHIDGKLQEICFVDKSVIALNAIYARVPFQQHSNLPEKLGCAINEQGFIEVNEFYKTSQPNIYACGDNVSPMRSVANAVAAGNFTGALINGELSDEAFK